jgi:hypothetical protein
MILAKAYQSHRLKGNHMTHTAVATENANSKNGAEFVIPTQSLHDYPTVDVEKAWMAFVSDMDATIDAIKEGHPDGSPFYVNGTKRPGVKLGYRSQKTAKATTPRYFANSVHTANQSLSPDVAVEYRDAVLSAVKPDFFKYVQALKDKGAKLHD